MPSPLAALSPLDGRYARTVDALREYFSEQALIRYRLGIELAWLEALAAERAIRELKPFSRATKAAFGRLVEDFSERDAEHIKNIEAETNHDVKAIEYWLKSKLATNREVQRSIEFVHFACTSEDVNNLAYALMVAGSRDRVMLPELDRVVAALRELARRHAALPMLSRAHGVLLDLDRDAWGYISLGYFTQKLRKGEVGSSTMPHKVNPIDFENSEGNVGVANALLRHLADKLPVSRWQRDLSDSTAQRNVGTALGHTLLAYAACLRGLDSLEEDPRRLAADLESNWEVLAEAVQQVMRRHGVPDAYERLKAISRGKRLDRGQLAAFVRKLRAAPGRGACPG